MTSDDAQTDAPALDIADTRKLTAFLEMRRAWLLQLKNEPVHSVYGQIVAMVDGDRTWRLANEMRRLAAHRHAADPSWRSAARNRPIADFMDVGYVSMQALAVRRLLEKKSSNPKGQIISLRRVLESVIGNRAIITRENYVCYDGLPFDPAPGAARALKEASAEPEGFTWIAMSGSEGWTAAAERHALFDQLSGISWERRGRQDLIRAEYFAELTARLDDPASLTLEDYANKFVAHSADARSREDVGPDIAVTADKIAACHAAIIEVFHALIGSVFFEGTHSPVVARSDPLCDLDQPWVATEQLGELRRWWTNHMNGVEDLIGVG